MNKRRPLLINIIVALLLLTIGILLSHIVKNWPLLVFKYDVDAIQAITNILTIGITIFLAYWVTQKLEKSKETDRVEKDLYIAKFDELYVFVEQVEALAAEIEIDYQIIITQFKRITTKHTGLFKHLSTSNINLGSNLEDTGKTYIKSVKDLLTLTPISPNGTPPLTIVNNKIRLSSDRKLEVDLAFDELKHYIFNIEISLNRT